MPKFQGSIFDVDGVLVDSPHEKAWRESLRELMESSWRGIRDRTTWSPDAFTSHVYQQYVSGKPRMSGARAALDYFHVPDAENRVAEYARLKQEMVVRLIQAGDFTAYPDALRFVIATKDAGMLIADASARPDAAGLLRRRRLRTRFRPRQTRPRDLPDRRARARRRAAPRDGDRGCVRRGPSRQGRRHGRDRHRPSRRRRPAGRGRRGSGGHHTR